MGEVGFTSHRPEPGQKHGKSKWRQGDSCFQPAQSASDRASFLPDTAGEQLREDAGCGQGRTASSERRAPRLRDCPGLAWRVPRLGCGSRGRDSSAGSLRQGDRAGTPGRPGRQFSGRGAGEESSGVHERPPQRSPQDRPRERTEAGRSPAAVAHSTGGGTRSAAGRMPAPAAGCGARNAQPWG